MNDRGNNLDLPTDYADLDYDGNFVEDVPFDLKGIPRRADDPDTNAAGFPADGFLWVDLGAYEQCGRLSPVAAAGDNTLKNRSLSMTATENAVTAIRVYLVSLHHPDPPNAPQFLPPTFTAFEEEKRWVGKPGTFLESQGSPGLGSFRAARLECTPEYRNWSTEGVFHVVGAEIIPSSTYRIESVAESCRGLEANCAQVSCAVEFTTARWGDVVAPFQEPSPASLSQPSGLDINEVINKLKGLSSTPKAFTQLTQNVVDLNIDVNGLDISAVVDAFKSFPYPYSGPCPCPSTVSCNLTACGLDPRVCTNPGTCVKTCTGGTNAEQPCVKDTHCPGGTCGPGYCRDKCARCSPAPP